MIFKKCLFLFFLLGGLILWSRCGDLFSDEEDKAVILTMFEGPAETGLYALFWDGKDDDDDFVSEGTYYARLFSRDITFTIEMQAEEGESRGSNNTQHIDLGDHGITELRQNTPNPFIIADGTMITFVIGAIDAGQSIQLTIRDEE